MLNSIHSNVDIKTTHSDYVPTGGLSLPPFLFQRCNCFALFVGQKRAYKKPF